MNKACSECGEDKPLTDYYRRADGRTRGCCKSCHIAKRNARVAADPRRYAAHGAKYRAAHRDDITARKTADYAAVRSDCIAAYGGACACCGETEPMFLDLDHVGSDGAAHRREVGQGTRFYRWLRKNGYPDSVQILCASCNQGKARNGGMCPHQQRALEMLLLLEAVR